MGAPSDEGMRPLLLMPRTSDGGYAAPASDRISDAGAL